METNYFFTKCLAAFIVAVGLFSISLRANAQVYEFDFTDHRVNAVESTPTNSSNLNALFDNDINTSYSVPSGGQTITIELANPILLSGYAIKTTATSVMIEYSLTGASWEPVASTGEPVDKEGYIFYISEFGFDKAYSTKYYRLVLNQGVVNEWQLFGVPVISAEFDFPEDLISTIGGEAQFTWANTTMAGTSIPANIFNRKFGSGDTYRASFKVNKGQLEIKYTLSSSQAVKRYSITPYNTGALFITRSPQNWKFYGSNTGISWSELDSRTNFTFPLLEGTPMKTTTMEFNISNSTSYNMYKFEILGGHDYLDLTEIQLFGNSITTVANIPRKVNEIEVYPRKGTVVLCSNSDKVVNYFIYNVSGQSVRNGKLYKNDNQEISLTEGVYLIKSDNSINKFIVQK